MGKDPDKPKRLLMKMVAALLMTATQTMVMIKNHRVQAEVSTLTSTVITRKTTSITAKEERIRTLTETLEKKQIHWWVS